MIKSKLKSRDRIRKGIRKKIFGTASIPRVSVFRSNTAIYVQAIDDDKGKTMVASSSREIKKKSINVQISKEVGESFAKKLKTKKINKIVFDRGGYLYHGNIKALAEGIRFGGLNF